MVFIMVSVEITNDIKIAFDGINISRFVKGDEVELSDEKANRLVKYKSAKLVEEVIAPDETKVVEVEVKEKPNKKGKNAKSK